MSLASPGIVPSGQNCRTATRSDELPEIAQQTDSSGVLLVANVLSADEVHRVIDLAAANGLHVQVWPGFRGSVPAVSVASR